MDPEGQWENLLPLGGPFEGPLRPLSSILSRVRCQDPGPFDWRGSGGWGEGLGAHLGADGSWVGGLGAPATGAKD